MKRRAFMHSLGSAVALAMLERGGAAAAPAGRQPNVVFIMTDQQFADAMSCRMGRRFISTPAMDGLAGRGMLFTRAYSSNPLCMPLRNSLFTGRYPHETRVTENAEPAGGLDPREFVCLGTYFRNAGYTTAYSGKWHLCFDIRNPDTHGFEILNGGSADNHDDRAAGAAIEFLRRSHDKPFLLVVSFLNPHNICEWARRLAGMNQRLNCGEIGPPPPLDQLPPPPANAAPPRNEPDGMTLMRRAYHNTKLFAVGNFTVEDWRKHRWGYYRMIEKVDGEIGKVLAALRQAGQEDNTLIIFTSDHGECAGAHGFNQKTVFYEESARVPLIIAWGGRTPAATCGELVNIGIDILPTMLDCAGLPISGELPGLSLRRLAQGQPTGPWRDHVVVENDMSQAGAVDGLTPAMEGRMVRTERYKYCVFSRGLQRESLIDLQADPGEMNDLAADPRYREILLSHRALLARFGREHNDPLVAELLSDGMKSRPFTPSAPEAITNSGNGREAAKADLGEIGLKNYT
ncbi:MAG: sulfatase-like hydrolase/transferase [bacterium]|nr:sulfatase-like hydrolase/transferase [bacterium]